jgi:hypothetical protein
MIKDVLYYLSKGQYRKARIVFEAILIWYKIKLIKKVNKVYRKIWPLIFGSWVLLILTWGTLQFKHDYDLIHNYAHIDALNEGIYATWRTDGSPGQDPPK